MTINIELKNKYRIVTGPFGKFVIEIKRWFWPFWIDAGYYDEESLEDAKARLAVIISKENFRREVVYKT